MVCEALACGCVRVDVGLTDWGADAYAYYEREMR